MTDHADHVAIQEPPLTEIKKQHSCVRQTCVTGCGCIGVFVVALLLILKFAATPTPKPIDEIPESIAENVPLYHAEAARHVERLSASKRNRSLEIATAIPKVITSPLALALDLDVPLETIDTDRGDIFLTRNPGWQDIYRYVKTENNDTRDIVTIEWNNLAAKPRFIYNFYQNELAKAAYVITNTSTKQGEFTINFHHVQKQINGIVEIEDALNEPGTDYVGMRLLAH